MYFASSLSFLRYVFIALNKKPINLSSRDKTDMKIRKARDARQEIFLFFSYLEFI